jgi:fatty acid desaturase
MSVDVVDERDPDDALEPSRGTAGLAAMITRDELRELTRPRAARVLAMLTLLLAAWLALGLAATRIDPWWARIPVWIVAGFLVNGLVQLGHDAWHHNLFARPWHNEVFGHLFSLLFGVSFSAARHAHLRHHWYNRTERDPDAYNVGAAGLRVKAQYYVVIFLGLALAPLHFNVLYPAAFYPRRAWPRHLAELCVAALAYVILFRFVLAPRGLVSIGLQVWLIPLAFATPWNGLKSVADHFANTWKGDRFHTATTVRTTALWSLLWNGLNYHLDHHLFPRVPGYNLARVHARIRPVLVEREAPLFDGYLRVFVAAFRAGPVYVDDGHRFLKGDRR